jgi:hypothetical protein
MAAADTGLIPVRGHTNYGLFADCTATTTLPATCAPWMAP